MHPPLNPERAPSTNRCPEATRLPSAITALIQACRKAANSPIGKIIKFSPVGVAGITLLLFALTREKAHEIDFPHEGEQFTLQDLTLREKIAQLMHGSPYGSPTARAIDAGLNHQKVDFGLTRGLSDWLTDWLKSDETIGGIHLFRADARSIDEANRTAIELTAQSRIPPFISMDVVGGYTKHLGLTREDARAYGVPEKFLKIAEENGNLELPSQEDLGRTFESLKTQAERIEFRKDMELYGAAMGRLCRDLGITINFAPVMDLVEDVDGTNFMAIHDETYGSKIHTVMVLSFHYIKGFQKVDGAMAGPKHFTGTGKVEGNIHEERKQDLSTMGIRDGSILPFENAIQGELFHSRIHPQSYPFDSRLRQLERDIRYLEQVLEYRIREGKPHDDIKGQLAQKRQDRDKFLRKHNLNGQLVPEGFTRMAPITGLMAGHAQTILNPDTPGSLSQEMMRIRVAHNLAFDGILWTDDLTMGSVQAHASATGCSEELDDRMAEVYTQALAAGATMPMTLHHSGSLDAIVERVQQAIDEGEDFDGDGTPDITMATIDRRVRAVLDQKAELGLLSREGSVYTNTALEYFQGTRAFQQND